MLSESLRPHEEGQVMFNRLTHNGRIWVLLLAWVVFVGLPWTDTFDLSDDVLVPATLGQAVIDTESDEFKSGMCLFASMPCRSSFLAVMSEVESLPCVCLVLWLPISDPPLYQGLSTYRICSCLPLTRHR
jgi:hypothetical protein